MNIRPLQEISAIYQQPFFSLIKQAREVYESNWGEEPGIQLCTLLSIKTGGCSEDCSYCAQSSHYKTEVESGKLMSAEEILPIAQKARENGTTRFCMGAAWKGIKETDSRFGTVLDTVRQVSKLGMEVCVTLGSLTEGAAQELKKAGVTAYNHNLDTSPEHYANIVTTHTFEDRVKTIQHVQKAGMAVCCGGIMGMGETVQDRIRFLQVLTELNPAPESIPINCLTAIPGTPLENLPPLDVFELVRMVATTRILFPRSKVRLSAGRTKLSKEGQALCFFAGANSIFYGDKLLTTENPGVDEDKELLNSLGLVSATQIPVALEV